MLSKQKKAKIAAGWQLLRHGTTIRQRKEEEQVGAFSTSSGLLAHSAGKKPRGVGAERKKKGESEAPKPRERGLA